MFENMLAEPRIPPFLQQGFLVAEVISHRLGHTMNCISGGLLVTAPFRSRPEIIKNAKQRLVFGINFWNLNAVLGGPVKKSHQDCPRK
jgi:hypothetical protein